MVKEGKLGSKKNPTQKTDHGIPDYRSDHLHGASSAHRGNSSPKQVKP
jgi:hypothetical protein